MSETDESEEREGPDLEEPVDEDETFGEPPLHSETPSEQILDEVGEDKV